MIPDLDRRFAADALHELRAEALAQARRAGLPETRAMDVVLAVHELAANSVRHGAGTGRLRMWKLARALYCQVDDGESASAPVSSWPSVPGHGLWMVRQVADHTDAVSGPGGSCVRLAFDLP